MAVGNQGRIYPSDTVNTSSAFKLEDEIIKVQLVGLQDGDCVAVEVIAGNDECDEKWVPYAPSCCGQMKISHPQNQFFINIPSRYRLKLSNRFGNDVTDPSWFENVEIYQTPVEGKNINLEGNCDMGCSAEVTCSPDGPMIDGVLCVPPNVDTYAVNVTQSASGWTIIMNDGSTLDVPLTSVDGSVDISGYDLSVDLPDDITSVDGSVTVNGSDLSVNFPIIPTVCEGIANLSIGNPIGG